MEIVGVIPARYGATRFEGKVLAPIDGQPMIQYVWQAAKKAKHLKRVIIACDDERILKAGQQFGAEVVMTSVNHPSGTDRIAEAIAPYKADIVVNIQGDEPLIDAQSIDNLAISLVEEKKAVASTLIKKTTNQEEIESPHVVKVVVDKEGYALYFSRSIIPFYRERNVSNGVSYYKHLGLYAYKRDFLQQYVQLPRTPLEMAEQLEQLRILEAGYKIKTVVTEVETVGVDTKEDLQKVEEIIHRGR